MLLHFEIEDDEPFCEWFKNQQNVHNLAQHVMLTGYYCLTQPVQETDKTQLRYLENHIESLKRDIEVYQNEVSRSKTDIADKIELEVMKKCQIREDQLRDNLNSYIIENEKYKALYTDTQTLLINQSSNVLGKEIQYLEEILRKKDEQLCMLQRSNMGKGNYGEELIIQVLKKHFSDCTVENTGKVGHCCDVKMTFPNGNFIVIESKYKESGVSKVDITKFESDVKTIKSLYELNFCGAVFVSMRNKNIPTKGDICFEVIEQRPVCYLGFEDASEFEKMFVAQMQVFVKLASCEFACLHRHNIMDDLLNDLYPYFEKMKKIKGNIQKMKVVVEDLDKNYQDIVTDTDNMIKLYFYDKNKSKRKKANKI